MDEQPCVTDLPAAPAAHESSQLFLSGPSAPCRLFLERAERVEVSLGRDHPFDRVGPERPDQLVLEIRDADVETEALHVGAGQVGAETRALERALEVALLTGVAESGEADVQPLRAEDVQEAADRVRTSDRDDGNALGVEVTAAALGERFQRELVAGAFDEDDRPWGVGAHEAHCADDLSSPVGAIPGAPDGLERRPERKGA